MESRPSCVKVNNNEAFVPCYTTNEVDKKNLKHGNATVSVLFVVTNNIIIIIITLIILKRWFLHNPSTPSSIFARSKFIEYFLG